MKITRAQLMAISMEETVTIIECGLSFSQGHRIYRRAVEIAEQYESDGKEWTAKQVVEEAMA